MKMIFNKPIMYLTDKEQESFEITLQVIKQLVREIDDTSEILFTWDDDNFNEDDVREVYDTLQAIYQRFESETCEDN